MYFMSNILCSIIIPFYNVPTELVDKCLTSIFSQDWGDNSYEVIFVNDGSPSPIAHSTQSLLDSFDHSTYIKQENKGLSTARNAGLAAASGEYIFFLDSDDFWFSNSIGQLLPCLKESKYDIIKFSSLHIYDSNIHAPHYSPTALAFESGCEYMSTHNIIKGACTYCYRRSFLNTQGIAMPEGIIHEDEYFLTQVFFEAKDVLISNIPLYAYIKREGSITSRTTRQQWLRSFHDFFATLKFTASLKSSSQITDIQTNAINSRMSFLICDYVYNVLNSTSSHTDKRNALSQLNEIGYYPLPKLGSNLKYNLLRAFSHNYHSMLVWAKTIRFILKLKSRNQNY